MTGKAFLIIIMCWGHMFSFSLKKKTHHDSPVFKHCVIRCFSLKKSLSLSLALSLSFSLSVPPSLSPSHTLLSITHSSSSSVHCSPDSRTYSHTQCCVAVTLHPHIHPTYIPINVPLYRLLGVMWLRPSSRFISTTHATSMVFSPYKGSKSWY